MSTHATPTRGTDRDVHAGAAIARNDRRISTETKSAFKTTEMIAYVAVLAAILIAGAIADGFGARSIWLYATILTVGYMVSRGLAKSGSQEPYTDDHDA
jgi:hypothetical protein